jgi:hypothetical protein
MTRYFVLWHNQAGLPVWDGLYETFGQASDATPMRDRTSDAFVVVTQNWRP